jgi:hypothetical protein
MSEGLKVFGAPPPRRPRFTSHWLRTGFLAFIGAVNLVAAIGLFGCGVYLLTRKPEGASTQVRLQVGTVSVQVGEEQPKSANATSGREALAIVCFALSLVPFSIAVLARTQFQMSRELALLLPPPESPGKQGP